MKRCDICLDKCNNPGECHCDTCNKLSQCYKFLHPTVRITTKCTQECEHCCFSCSPSKTRMMSKKVADEICLFAKNNNIHSFNVMGGEFFLNPDWEYIIEQLLKCGNVRVVSNSDWAWNDTVKEGLIRLNNGMLSLSLSNDKWHTNKGVETASAFLQEHGVPFNVEKDEEGTDSSIVPIGRGQMTYGLYSMFACYCHNPIHQYSFLIDEDGVIYKCPFGVLDYADVHDYVDGGFAEVFKDFNKRFYDIFLPSCTSCIRVCHDRRVKNN